MVSVVELRGGEDEVDARASSGVDMGGRDRYGCAHVKSRAVGHSDTVQRTNVPIPL